MQIAPCRGDLHSASPRQRGVHKAWQQVSHQEYNDVRFRRLSSCKKTALAENFPADLAQLLNWILQLVGIPGLQTAQETAPVI